MAWALGGGGGAGNPDGATVTPGGRGRSALAPPSSSSPAAAAGSVKKQTALGRRPAGRPRPLLPPPNLCSVPRGQSFPARVPARRADEVAERAPPRTSPAPRRARHPPAPRPPSGPPRSPQARPRRPGPHARRILVVPRPRATAPRHRRKPPHRAARRLPWALESPTAATVANRSGPPRPRHDSGSQSYGQRRSFICRGAGSPPPHAGLRLLAVSSCVHTQPKHGSEDTSNLASPKSGLL